MLLVEYFQSMLFLHNDYTDQNEFQNTDDFRLSVSR